MSTSDFQEVKLDVKEIKADIAIVKETLAKNTATLEEHMKRTALNEDRIQKIEYWALGLLAAAIIALLKLS